MALLRDPPEAVGSLKNRAVAGSNGSDAGRPRAGKASVASEQVYDRALRRALSGLDESSHVAGDGDDASLWWTVLIRDQTLRSQGWKLHVSSSVGMAAELLRSVLPLLVERRVAFKVPSTLGGVLRINSGRAGPLQIGKIVTVYPATDDEAGQLASALDARWCCPRAPLIVTDLRLHRRSSIYLRYGAISDPLIICDSQGRRAYGLRCPDGSIIRDERRPNGAQVSWAAPPIPTARASRTRSPKVIVCGHRFFLVGSLQKSPKSATYLALDDSLRSKVVKFASRGVAEDRFGFDAWDRLGREHSILLGLRQQGIACPAPLGLSHSARRALVLEDINGDAIAELPPTLARMALPSLTSAVARLHAAGIVHRDLKLSHAILRDGRLYLIDFEFSAPVGSIEFPAGGTRSYMAPESDLAPVTQAQDVYALGACIAHAFLDVDPAGLMPGPKRLVGLLHALTHRNVAPIVLAAMAEKPEARTSLAALHERVSAIVSARGRDIDYGRRLCKFAPSSQNQRNRWARKIAETASATRLFLGKSPADGSWRDPRFARPLRPNGIASGAAGTLIGLASIDAALSRNDFIVDIDRAARWLQSQPISGPACGLFTGEAGIALALAIASGRLTCAEFLESARMRLQWAVDHVSEPGLFSGSAGVLWTGVLISAIVDASWPSQIVAPLLPLLCHSVISMDRMLFWPSSDYDKQASPRLLGVAEGACGIAMALGIWGRKRGQLDLEQLAIEILLEIFTRGRMASGNQIDGVTKSKLSHPAGSWAIGAPGYLWALLQSFDNDQRLRNALDWAVNEVAHITLLASPTYLKGMAAQLEVWRMLVRIDRYRHLALRRASLSVRLLECLGGRGETGWLWPSDEPDVFVPTLWDGFLGPACAVALYRRKFHGALLSPEWLRAVSQPVE